MKHSLTLRETLERKALVGMVSQEAIAKEFGTSRSSVQNWLRKYRLSGPKQLTEAEKRLQDGENGLDACMEMARKRALELQ